MRATLIAVVCFLAGGSAASAQGVLVAPHAVIIDHRARSTALTLYNPGAEPAEIAISLFFGYPVTDSTGELELVTPEGRDPQSATGWIEAYPRRMVIGPLERQTVRLLARPPGRLADGEYWSRIMIAAKGGAVPVTLPDSAPPGIAVGLNLEVRTIIPLQYRVGTARTGLALDPPRVARDGDSLVVRARMTREGNAAFLGTVRGNLTDAADRVVAPFTVPIAVYRTIDPRFTLASAGLAPGRYRLNLSVIAERADLPPEQVLRAAPASATVELTLP